MIQDIASQNSIRSYPYIIRLVFYHVLALFATYIVYGLINGHSLIPGIKNLLRDDAINYLDIKDNGYSFSAQKGSIVAFFPGFPYLWKLTGLGIYGISILNACIFLGSFIWLCRQFKPDPAVLLLFLSFPPMLFMFVPFSEALFFLPSALLLTGLLKRNNVMIVSALFLCSLCRSAANVFLPAIIIMEIIAADNPHRIKNIIIYAISSLAGIAIVAWLQYTQTGQWMGFMTTQQYWEVKLRFPSFPLHTWGNMQYLDGASLLAGLLAGSVLLAIIIKFIRKQGQPQNKALVFSLLYLAGLTLFTLAFKGGNLFSLNRYLVPSAFFFVAFFYLIRQKKFTYTQVGLVTLGIFVFWLLFGSYVHIRVLAGYMVFSIYLSLYFLLNHLSPSTQKLSFYLLYICNIIVQVHLIYKFFGDNWVG